MVCRVFLEITVKRVTEVLAVSLALMVLLVLMDPRASLAVLVIQVLMVHLDSVTF